MKPKNIIRVYCRENDLVPIISEDMVTYFGNCIVSPAHTLNWIVLPEYAILNYDKWTNYSKEIYILCSFTGRCKWTLLKAARRYSKYIKFKSTARTSIEETPTYIEINGRIYYI